MCRRPRTARAPGPHRRRNRPVPRGRRDPTPRLSGTRAGPPVRERQRDTVPDGDEFVRHVRQDRVPVSRRACRLSRKLVALKIDPMQYAKTPWKYLSAVRPALSMLPRYCPFGTSHRSSPRHSRRCPNMSVGRTTAAPSSLCPLSLHRRPTQAGPDVVQSRHVPRADWPVMIISRTRKSGSHYQIHRSIGVHHKAAVDRGEPSEGQYLRRRGAVDDSLRRDAVTGRNERTDVRRCVAKASHPHDQTDTTRPPFTRRPTSASAARSIPKGLKPEGPFGDHLGYYSLQHPFPCCEGGQGLPSQGRHLADDGGRHGRRKKTPRSATSSMRSPAPPFPPSLMVSKRSTPLMPPVSIHCSWRSAANAMFRTTNRPDRKNC